jgi:glycerate kinase
MLQALGARLLDDRGRPIPPGGAGLLRLDRVDLSGLDPRWEQASLIVACDVANPLLGERGSAAVFAPQKGAGPAEVLLLERALGRWVAALDAVVTAPMGRIAAQPGAGASGGIGFAAMAALGATPVSGADLMLDLVDADRALESADFVITGEGSFDHQTRHGKAPGVLTGRAQARGVPVAVVAGAVGLDSITLGSMGVHAVWSLVDVAGGREAAMAGAAQLIRRCGSEAMHWWQRREVARFVRRPAP